MVAQNDMQYPSPANRLTDDMFNQFACFGRELKTSEPIPTPVEELIYHIFARHELSIEQFIKLFMQNVLLSTYLSQDFPFLSLFTVDHPVKGIVEDMLKRVCAMQDIHPSTSGETTNTLVALLKEALDKLYIRVRNGKKLSEVEQNEFIKVCENFYARIREHFQEAQNIFTSVEDNTALTKEMFIRCMHLFYTECADGKDWAMKFFGYSKLNYARINLSISDRIQGGMSIQTLANSEERYIECMLSPCLSLDEFIKAPMFIFHEYLSHLGASIYRGKIENEQQKEEVIASYRGIRWKVTEGWMVHVAETFLRDKMPKLLSENRKHLVDDMKMCVTKWKGNMHSQFGGEVYANEAAVGGKIADQFLTLLSENISPNNEKQARLLYYRLSFDLITHYTSPDFTHLRFVDVIESLYNKNQALLVQALQESLSMDADKQYINIETFWQLIKEHSPKIDLPTPRKTL